MGIFSFSGKDADKGDVIQLFAEEGTVDKKAAFVNMKNVQYESGVWEAESTTDDPQIFLYKNEREPLVADQYRFIKFSLLSNRNTKGQLIWWLTDGKWQASKHFSISTGWSKYCFDLKSMPTFGAYCGTGIGWEGLVSAIRLDPSEEAKVLTKFKEIELTSALQGKLTMYIMR